MTQNQLNYLKLMEEHRANVTKEEETHRSNVAKEAETARSNIASEGLTRQKTYAEAGNKTLPGLGLVFSTLSDPTQSNLSINPDLKKKKGESVPPVPQEPVYIGATDESEEGSKTKKKVAVSGSGGRK